MNLAEKPVNKEELPRGWMKSTLGEITEHQKGKIPKDFSDKPKKGFLPYIDIRAFEKGNVRRYATTDSTTLVSDDDILVVWDGARFGLAGFGQEGVLGSTLMRLNSDSLDPKFLYYFIVSNYSLINSKPRGTGTPHVEPDVFWPLSIPIPPYPEQKRIADKIDELFSDLDAGEANLRKAKALIEKYRQSVLKAAVTGELTRDWRKNHPPQQTGKELLDEILKARRKAFEKSGKKYKAPVEPTITDTLPRLPNGWIWTTIGSLGNVSGGLTKNAKRNEFPLKWPYLRVANVYENELRLEDIRDIGIKETEVDRVRLEHGDLLIVEGNGSIDQLGRVALWDESIKNCAHQNHLIKVRFHDLTLAKYVLVWLISREGKNYIKKVASSTSGLHTLSISKVRNLPIPLPTEKELELIFDEFESAETQVDAMKALIHQQLNKSRILRQSILKDAFSGKLVPQDPQDEDASILLERIKQERIQQKKIAPKRQNHRRKVKQKAKS